MDLCLTSDWLARQPGGAVAKASVQAREALWAQGGGLATLGPDEEDEP